MKMRVHLTHHIYCKDSHVEIQVILKLRDCVAKKTAVVQGSRNLVAKAVLP